MNMTLNSIETLKKAVTINIIILGMILILLGLIIHSSYISFKARNFNKTRLIISNLHDVLHKVPRKNIASRVLIANKIIKKNVKLNAYR